VVWLNRAMRRLTGFGPAELHGQPVWDVLLPDDEVEPFRRSFGAYRLSALPDGYDTRWRIRSGGERLVRWTNRPLRSPDGGREFVLISGLDVTDQRAAEERMAWLADHDDVTALFNRRRFDAELRRELARAERYGHDVAVLLVDIDDLKLVNDRYGHAEGDKLIRWVGRALGERLRASDLAARVGGDEFAVLMPFATADDAERLARDVQDRIAQCPTEDVRPPTVSVGVVECRAGDDFEALLRHVDRALYRAKDAGRGVIADSGSVGVRRSGGAAEAHALKALRSLTGLLERRDPAAYRQSAGVADWAERLADRLGWGAAGRRALRDAALIHDIGNVAIAPELFAKPGRLTTVERAIMEDHVRIGAQMAALALDATQVGWVLHHHERFDGTGYPNRLAGEAIPTGARVLAVADAWEATQRERPHRSALTRDEATLEIRAQAGTQFDPAAVEALLADAG
jgi:diguanylate cyclase (GGDEF)-like protein/PAS domain S-box-containing protein